MASACDRRAPTAEPPQRLNEEPPERLAPHTSQGGAPASTAAAAQMNELAALAAEAGVELSSDPAAPSGDLKSDVEAFTTLDACVRAHRLQDALLADALDTLGYDTFTRDACRLLQALKSKSVEPCQAMTFGPLRARCEIQVATLTGNPALCPKTGSGSAAAPRDAICLARAGRDPRLCVAAAEGERGACRAVVTGDLAACGGDRSCARQADRWRSLRERAASKPDFVSACRVEIAVDGQAPQSVDFGKIAEMGAVLKDVGDKPHLIVGRPKTPLWARPEDPWATPQLFLDVTLPRMQPARTPPESDAVELGVSELTLDLLVPKVAALSAVTARERRLTFAQSGSGLGASIDLALEAVLTQAPHTYRVTIRLRTFVRESTR